MVFILLIFHASGGRLSFPDLSGIYLQRFIAKSISATITHFAEMKRQCDTSFCIFVICNNFLFVGFLELLSADHSASL